MDEDGKSPFHSGKYFEEFGLKSDILQGLYESHFDEASSIQMQSIPAIITPPYKSLLAQGQNGTGKTLSFVTGMMQRIDINDPQLQAICLFSTRELVIQTYTDYIQKIAKYYPVKTTVLIRDPPIPQDLPNAQLILSTPMQLDQAIDEGIKLASVKILVIDEADDVLKNKTFVSFFNFLFQRLTQLKTQVILFSATVTQQVHDFVGQYIKPDNLNLIEVKKNNQFIPTNKHLYIRINEDEKLNVIRNIFESLASSHTFIFVNRKAFAKELCNILREQGYDSQYISNELRRTQRDSIVKEFKDGAINVLICTNMVSRGLDIPVARAVVNFDMPLTGNGKIDVETYMHRQGRTGRFERNGVVINFITNDTEMEFITNVENDYGLKFIEFTNDREGIQTIFDELRSISPKPAESAPNVLNDSQEGSNQD